MPTGKVQLDLHLDPSIDARKLQKILEGIKRSLGDLGSDIKIDPKAFAGIEDEVRGANSELDELRSKISDLEKQGKGGSAIPRALGFTAITGAITQAAGAVQGFTQPLADLDKQVKNIGTLGVSGFEEFRSLALEASKEIPDSAATIAEATYNAISAGISGTNQEITEFVKTAGRAAVAGVSDTNTAVNALTTVLNAYKLETSEAGAVSDTFFAGIKLGKTSFAEMSAGLANIIPAASAAGVEFKEVSAAIAQMTSLGVPTSQATTQMRAALVELQKPAGPLQKVLDNVGLSAEEMRKSLADEGLIATLQKVEQSASSMGLSLTQVFGSAEAASAALLVTGDNAAEANRKLAAVDTEIAAQAASGAFDVAATGIEVRTKLVFNTIQAAAADILGAFGDGFTVITNSAAQVTPLIAGLANVGALIPEGTGAKIKDLAVSLITKLIPATVATTGANGAATISFSAMWTAATGPIGLAIAGIAAVGVGIAALAGAFDETAEDRLADAEAAKAQTEEQIRQNEKNIEAQKGVSTLAKRYEELAEKEELTAGESEELRKITQALDRQYPDLIDQTATYKENLEGVAEIGKRTTEELGKLNEQNTKLQKTLTLNNQRIAAARRDLAISALRDESTTFLEDVEGFIAKGLEIYTGGLVSAEDAQSKFVTEFGKARTAFEKGLFNAKSLEDINNAEGAILDFLNAQKGLDPDRYLEISTAIGNAANETRSYFEALKGIEEVTPTAAGAPDPNEVKTKTDKAGAAIRSYLDQITAAERAANKIRETLRAEDLADQERREIALAELAAGEARQAVQDEIDRAAALKAGKEITAEEQRKLLAALNEKLLATEEQGQAKIGAVRGKYELQREKDLRAAADREASLAADLAAGRVAALEAVEIRSNAESIENARQLAEARLEALRAGNEIALEEAIRQNEAVAEAQKGLDEAIARGNAEAIEEGRRALAEARLQAITDPRILAVIAAQNKAEREQAAENAREIENARIRAIEDAGEREREIAIAGARDAYEARLAEARGNTAEELAAFREFLAAKREAEAEYLRASDYLFEATVRFRDALLDRLRENLSRDNQEAIDAIREKLRDDERELYESLKRTEIQYREFSSDLIDARRSAEDELAEIAGPGIVESFLEGLSGGLQAAREQFEAAAGASFDSFVSNQDAQFEYEKQISAARLALAAAEREGKVEEARKLEAELAELRTKSGAAEEQAAEDRTAIFLQTATATGAALGDLIAQGEVTFASFSGLILDSALSLLEKQIPIWVAGIFGTSVASLSLGGIAVAAGLTATLYALVGAAKAAIGRAGGEVDISGPGTTTSDDIPRLVSRRESILTAAATMAPGNADAFRWANRTGRPLSEYFSNRGSVRSAGRDPGALGDPAALSRRIDATNEKLDRIARYVSRETFGKQDIRLEAKIDLAKLERIQNRGIQITNARA